MSSWMNSKFFWLTRTTTHLDFLWLDTLRQMNPYDHLYMRLALQEAGKGQGRTSPNPCVGAVIVRGDTIVGSGYHRRAGTPHAEVNAIAAAGAAARGATMYVTLEPCNHSGRTPPCTRAVLAAGIARVVVGMLDPNPSVAGGGAAFLAAQGIEVEIGVLEEQCRALNRGFIKHSAIGLPWVVMKAGMSLDGKITFQRGRAGQLTCEQSRLFTHRLRDTLDAILVGVDTALIDDPLLTTRLPDGAGRDPLRVILDTTLRLAPQAAMLRQQSDAATWVFCGTDAPAEREEQLTRAGAVIRRVGRDKRGRLDLAEVLRSLGRADITSVLVEGGATVHGSMLQQGLVDQVYLFVAPFFIGRPGTPLVGDSAINDENGGLCLTNIDLLHLGDDVLIQGLVLPADNAAGQDLP